MPSAHRRLARGCLSGGRNPRPAGASRTRLWHRAHHSFSDGASGSSPRGRDIGPIDHGKATLADRMLQLTEVLDDRSYRTQYLDRMDIERERSITIEVQGVRLPSHGERGGSGDAASAGVPGSSAFQNGSSDWRLSHRWSHSPFDHRCAASL